MKKCIPLIAVSLALTLSACSSGHYTVDELASSNKYYNKAVKACQAGEIEAGDPTCENLEQAKLRRSERGFNNLPTGVVPQKKAKPVSDELDFSQS
ncbi:EexN family lipoprotein [Brackiella oedipodis]|uniref:EexN family lipoprotein n=1 Tax=Brackiella oedipodis TaxID=124225 RepID=UPI00048C25EC|nr:EexN family lipoprotein [Brackiella oedipodis]